MGWLAAFFRGRIGRLYFIFGSLAISVIADVAGALFLGLVVAYSAFASERPGFGLIVALIVAAVATLVVGILQLSLLVRRLHDVGLSGWWFLLLLLPAYPLAGTFVMPAANFFATLVLIVQVVFAMGLALLPGSMGKNSYGDPLPDGYGFWKAISAK